MPLLPATSTPGEPVFALGAPRMQGLERELAGLLALSADWDREGAEAPTLTAVWHATRFARELIEAGLEIVGVAPSPVGGVVLNLIRDGRAASLEVYNDSSAAVFLYGAGSEGTWRPADATDPGAIVREIRNHLPGA